MRIGIMGGTFDPIHIGHLILGETAWQQFFLDRVLYMPAGNPPHKRNRAGRAGDEERVEMVRLAIADNPHFELSLMEMNADGYSYTYRTLARLKREHPEYELYFILGEDSLRDFCTWKEPQRICDQCTLLAGTRSDTDSEGLLSRIREIRDVYHASVERLDNDNLDIASHELRKWVSEGRSIRYYVPDAVAKYISDKKLYI